MAEPFIGEIRLFAFGLIPKGWLPCDGQLLNIQQNTALFSILGSRYGGDGVRTFAIPNLQGRTPIHRKYGSIPVGSAAGESTHTLTINEMPQHTHQVNASSLPADKVSPTTQVWASTAETTPLYSSTGNTTMNIDNVSATGANQPHNNMQPYLTVQFCIALNGIYPPRD